jgi:hypothetical protein
VRHDLAPYTQFPETIAADFGVDRIVLEPVPVPVPAVGGGWLAALGFAVLAAMGAVLRRRAAAA